MGKEELSPAPSLWLKEQTRDEHVRTEHMPLAQAMAKGTLTIQEYASLLYAYAELHADVELAGLEAGLAMLLEPPFKSTLAHGDLKALHVRPEHVPVEIRRSVAQAKRANGPPFAVGALLGRLYVLEGSALGAAMLYPVLARSLSLTTGISYFRGHGRETMPRWQRFRGVLDLLLIDELRREQAREGALQTFRDMQAVFEAIRAHAQELGVERRLSIPA